MLVQDVRAAARLALPHRRRRNPFDAPGLDEELLDRILGDDEPEPDPEPPTPGPDDPDRQGPSDAPSDASSQDGPSDAPPPGTSSPSGPGDHDRDDVPPQVRPEDLGDGHAPTGVPGRLEDRRRAAFGFFRDRRPELYGRLAQDL